MILLEIQNRIIFEALEQRFSTDPNEKPEIMDMTLAEFDGVTYHVSTPFPEERNKIRISMYMKCYKSELVKYGVNDIMKREYGLLLSSEPEAGHDVTVDIDQSTLTEADRARLPKQVALMKCFAMASCFEKAFDAQIAGKLGELMPISYRDDESIYVRAMSDRVTVIFSTLFKDETDKVFGKVFLQEFVDCRRQPSLQNAPQVLYSNRDLPLELSGIAGAKVGDNVGYVTFVLFPRHYTTPEQRFSTISLIQNFRDYLHYHIKCSKAYMHSRMRGRVDSWMKVINRAKPEIDDKSKEKKLASGKTFVRKV